VAGLFGAVAPFGALPVFLDAEVRPADRPRALAVMVLAALALLSGGVLLAQPFLDWLDVSPENFQLAAGVIMLPQAVQLLWRGRTLSAADAGIIVPLASPLLAGPASLAAAMTYGARFGEAEAIGASAIVLAVTGALLLAGTRIRRRLKPGSTEALGRFNGAFLVVIAIEMIVDGVQSV